MNRGIGSTNNKKPHKTNRKTPKQTPKEYYPGEGSEDLFGLQVTGLEEASQEVSHNHC